MYTTLYLPKRNLKILTLTVRNAVIFAALLTAAYFTLPRLSSTATSSTTKDKTIFPAPSNWAGSPSDSVGSPSSSPSAALTTSFGALLK